MKLDVSDVGCGAHCVSSFCSLTEQILNSAPLTLPDPDFYQNFPPSCFPTFLRDLDKEFSDPAFPGPRPPVSVRHPWTRQPLKPNPFVTLKAQMQKTIACALAASPLPTARCGSPPPPLQYALCARNLDWHPWAWFSGVRGSWTCKAASQFLLS